MSDRPVWYEPHPCSAERKAELRAQGFQVIDAVFKPADVDQPEPQKPAESKPVDANGDGVVTAAELKAALTERGIEFRANASKASLQALLDGAKSAT